ncbi:MAG: S41 family peptidase [Chloroflexi bacterium]|nr:S41 family peptidase [Chloroflexota bacterium]
MLKTIRVRLLSLVLIISLVFSFGAGCVLKTNNTSVTSSQGLDVVDEAWGIIFSEYVAKDKLNAGALSQGAIKGIIEALDDPYTSYLDAETFRISMSHFEGKFEGIGAYVGFEEKQIIVIAPIAGSPAARAGIKPGDAILEIDGNSTEDMSLEEAVARIRGAKGTPVKLLILHRGETNPAELEIIRAEIEVPSVNFEMREDIALINIHFFSERTDEELTPILENLSQEKATAIILDLRSNPGGLLDEVVDVASHFLTQGVVVSVVDNRGEKTSSPVNPHVVTTDLPMVVLTDNYSASGSEVLSGALQDYSRAAIAGTKTFGKGSVNTLYQLKDGSGLYITIARWLTPNGRMIEGEGITPDYVLEQKGEDAIQWAIDYLHSSQTQAKATTAAALALAGNGN